MLSTIAGRLWFGACVLVLSLNVQAFQDLAVSNTKRSESNKQYIENIDQAVDLFFAGWKNGQAERCRELFVSTEVPIVHLTYVPNKRRIMKVNHVTAEKMMDNFSKAPPKFLRLESKQTDLLGENLAVTKAVFLKSGKKGYAIITSGRENEDWKIISLTFEERFNW